VGCISTFAGTPTISNYQLLKARVTHARGKRKNLAILPPKKKVRN
jgi:hypothetical protein